MAAEKSATSIFAGLVPIPAYILRDSLLVYYPHKAVTLFFAAELLRQPWILEQFPLASVALIGWVAINSEDGEDELVNHHEIEPHYDVDAPRTPPRKQATALYPTPEARKPISRIGFSPSRSYWQNSDAVTSRLRSLEQERQELHSELQVPNVLPSRPPEICSLTYTHS